MSLDGSSMLVLLWDINKDSMKKLIIISLIVLVATGCKKFVVSDDIITSNGNKYVEITMDGYDNLKMLFMIKDDVATVVDEVYTFYYYNKDYDSTYEGIDLVIPSSINVNGDEYIVKYIDEYAFQNDYNLHSVTIPNTVIDIGKEAFYHCDNLCFITCLSTTPSNIKTPLFTNCNSFQTIYVPKESVGLYKIINGWENYASYIVGIE